MSERQPIHASGKILAWERKHTHSYLKQGRQGPGALHPGCFGSSELHTCLQSKVQPKTEVSMKVPPASLTSLPQSSLFQHPSIIPLLSSLFHHPSSTTLPLSSLLHHLPCIIHLPLSLPIIPPPSSLLHHPSSIILPLSSLLHPPPSTIPPPSSSPYHPSSSIYPPSIITPPSSLLYHFPLYHSSSTILPLSLLLHHPSFTILLPTSFLHHPPSRSLFQRPSSSILLTPPFQ